MRRFAFFVLLALTVGSITAAAQFRTSRGVRLGELPPQRDGFTFCRLQYSEIRREAGGQGWSTDYELADQNLMIRLTELTKTRITTNQRNGPFHVVTNATDPSIYSCPFLFASDVGTVGFSAEEVDGLRQYLLKGGFLWVDDFWGPAAWRSWSNQIERVLPEYEIVPLTIDHKLFSTFYFVDEIPQIPSIQYWRSSGGATSERGSQSAEPQIYGIFNEDGSIMVLMSHNTDIADGWEREGEDFEFFHSFSPRGYAVGINVAIWAMTH
jgi:hypothetical protein